MNKFSWLLFEQWATAKAIKFGLVDEWVDFVCWIVSKRVSSERASNTTNTHPNKQYKVVQYSHGKELCNLL